MSSLPLHPAIVHIPLGLAFVLPALALGFAWALWTGRVRPRAWLVVAALQAALVGAGWLALNTGQREEDRVEKVVPKSAIAAHESAAEQFVWGAAATLAVVGMVPLIRRREVAQALTVAAVAGTIGVAFLGVRVGHAGGQLVYRHNAGAAYATAAAGATQDKGSPALPHTGDDDDR